MTIQEIREQIENAMPHRKDNNDNSAAANLARNAKSSDDKSVDGGVAKIVFCACEGSAKNLQFCLYKQNNNLFKLKLEHCGKDFETFLSGRRFDSYGETDIRGGLNSIWTALEKAQRWFNNQDTRKDSSIRKLYEEWRSTQNPQDSKSSQKKTSGKNKAGEQQPSFEDALNEEWGQVQKLLKEIDESSHDVAAERLLWKNPEQNPWIEFSQKIDSWLKRKENGEDVEDIKKYILKGDEENQKLKKFCTPERGEGQIHLEIPPQPYIGDPKANIWLLPMNPSYSEMDIYDMVKCHISENDPDDLKRRILEAIRFRDKDGNRGYRNGEINSLLRYFFTEGSDSNDSLSNRKNLMQNQLSFESTDFYVLNKPFKTVQTREEIRKASGETVERKDDTKLGSYEWWDDYFFSGEKSICRLIKAKFKNEEDYRKNALNKFFVLESFPYHSRNFGDIKPWIHSPSHFAFWVMMVAYALTNKKILLCRGMDIAGRVVKIAEEIVKDCADEAKQKRIFVCKNQQSFSVSTGNFISYEAQEAIDRIKSNAEKDFVGEIDRMLNEQQQPPHDSAGA